MELIHKTVGQCLRERAQKTADMTGLEIDQWRCTYQQLDLYVDRTVLQMERIGIRHGTHVGIWGINSGEWIITFLALTRMGAIPVLFNSLYTQAEMKSVLNYSEVEYLYYGRGNKKLDYSEIIADIILDVPKIRFYVELQEAEFPYYDVLLTQSEIDLVSELENKATSQDIACMIFTSGTTSEPKAVMLTHYNLVNNAIAMAEAMHWVEEDRMCFTVPLFHCFGITASLIPCILCGVTICLIANFRTEKIWNAIASGCNILNGVPSMFMMLVNKREYDHISADGVKSGMVAGSPLSQMEYETICRRFTKMHLQPAYGQTETSPCVSIADWDAPVELKASSVGRILEHVQVRIVNPETGVVLGTNQDGEIQVKGYNLMKGYYNRPEETQKTIPEDGWLRTGDIGHMDSQNNLFITGRLKEIIIRCGENIAPKEIEAEIRKVDWVEDVKVIGVPSPRIQEAVAACLIVKKDCIINPEESIEEMLDFLEDRLAHYKIPEHVLLFKEFPMNASGKIQLAKLKDLAINQIGRQ